MLESPFTRPDLQWIADVHRAHRGPWLCHEAWSEPPLLPLTLRAQGSRPPGEDLILTGADGSRFRAHLARASVAGDAGIVIAPDVRGLHSFYSTLADRFAEAGINAITFDYFGRTDGTDVPPGSFYDGVTYQTSPFYEHVQKTTPGQIHADIRATSAQLRQATGVRRMFLTGFCFGGRVAFNAAAEQPDLTGVIGFYGMPIPRNDDDKDAPSLKASRTKAAVLGLFGGADQGIPQTAVDQYARTLTDHAVRHKLVTYPGATHSFFDRRFDEFREACDDAWRRMLGFIRTGDPTVEV